jgi:ribosomal protein S18 acetylase RimI-like enzyme
MPLMGLALDDLVTPAGDPLAIESPPLEVVGAVNEHAYDDFGIFGPLVSGLRDERVTTYGVVKEGQFVCVALTLRIGDDVGIHYVATEQAKRGRGLASRLLGAIMVSARNEGLASATLQASADGLSVYRRLGFRQVGTLRAFMRPDRGDAVQG